MFKKKEERVNPYMINPNANPYGGYPQNQMPNMPISQNYEIARLETEINELRRVVSELVKRVGKLENFLGIRGDNYTEFEKLY